MVLALGPWGAIQLLGEAPWGDALLSVWLFVLGTLFGSFANVVVYRLPRQRSLLWPPSHCPKCKHAIRWRDNIPIVGWMLLGGKCRDCGLPISARYVLVETMFGVLLATIGWREGIEGLANLPVRPLLFPGGSTLSDWNFVGYHVLLVGTLVCAALIEYDRKSIPRSLLIFSGCCGLMVPLIWLAIRPVPLGLALPEMWPGNSVMLAAVEGGAGLATGILAGLLIWPAMYEVPAPRDRQVDAVYQLAMVGSFLGWQAMCGIAVVSFGLHSLSQLLALGWSSGDRLGWSTWLAGVTFVWICFWSTIVRAMPCWGQAADGTALVACGLILAVASPVVRLLSLRKSAMALAASPRE